MRKKKHFGFYIKSDKPKLVAVEACSLGKAIDLFIDEVKCCTECKILFRWKFSDTFSYIITHPSKASFSSPITVEVYEE